MLEKNYLLNFILQKLDEGVESNEICDLLQIEDMSMMLISYVVNSGEKWGQELSNLDILDMYTEGFTFLEIAWIKGVTQEAIRISVSNTARLPKKEIKQINKKNREDKKNIIIYEILVREAQKTSKELSYRKSGYSRSVFNRLYRESIKWFELQNKEGVSDE